MIRHLFLVGAALAIHLCMAGADGAEPKPDEPKPDEAKSDHSARKLVAEALRAGLRGDVERRRELLVEARAADTESAAANWHNGRLQIDGQWMSIAEAEAAALENSKLRTYVQQRARYAGSLEGEAKLAAWCQRMGLSKQAYAHWYQVLRYNPQHKSALRALKARWFGGLLFPAEEVEREVAARKRLASELKDSESAVDEWRKALIRGDEDARRAAVTELRGLRGENAIPLLTATLLEPASEEADTVRLQTLGLEIIGELEDPRSVAILAWHASMATNADVRDAAKRQLLRRPDYEYIPVLLAGMQMPVKVSYDSHISDRRITTTVVFEQEGPGGRRRQGAKTAHRMVGGEMYAGRLVVRQSL